MSTYVVADFDSSSGVKFAIEALKSMVRRWRNAYCFYG